MMVDFLDWWSERGVLVGDGAMATELFAAGLPLDGCPESWNLERPEAVRAVAAAYLDAGAEILTTNSFGANPRRLAAHGLAERCAEINRAAAGIAREAAGGRARVAGSIGPTGERLDPAEPGAERQAFDGFRLQAESLAEGGVDLLVVETMTDPGEAATAVRAAAGTGLPVIVSMAFGAGNGGLFPPTRDAIARAAASLREAGAAGMGANCGAGPESLLEVVRILGAESGLPILVQPAAGIPATRDGRLRFPLGPEEWVRFIPELVRAGATWIGGCCGTTPDHLRAAAREVRKIAQTVRSEPARRR